MYRKHDGPEIMYIFLLGVSVLIFASRLSHGFGTAPAPSTTPSPKPSPVEVKYVEFKPAIKYSTPVEREKIRAAELLVNELKNSECVFNFLRNRRLIQTGGRTSLQVAEHIKSMSGTVPVEMYFRADGLAIAYRQPPHPTIHLNRRVFTHKANLCLWASTMIHEALGHSIGNYGHDFNWSPPREFSVPYSLNHAVTECCQ